MEKKKTDSTGEGGGVEKSEASAEVRDERGKILFSFHVIKYLLCLHTSLADCHSGLEGQYRDCWVWCGTATQSYWPWPS